MNNRSNEPGRHGQQTPRPGQKQQEQGGHSGRQQGGFPHEDGGWGQQPEEEKIRDDGFTESQPGGERDDLMDKQNQRQPRTTGI